MSALDDAAPTLAKLRAALATLSSTLDPLLATPLAALAQQLEAGSAQAPPAHAERVQTKSGEASRAELDGRLDAARLNVSVAYVLLDLVWSECGASGARDARVSRREKGDRTFERRGGSRYGLCALLLSTLRTLELLASPCEPSRLTCICVEERMGRRSGSCRRTCAREALAAPFKEQRLACQVARAPAPLRCAALVRLRTRHSASP